jgi:hypothetical protein
MTLLETRLAADPPAQSHLEVALNEARKRVQVHDDELKEARRRRKIIGDALKAEFGGRIYFNGSVAHGDALYPLTDVDLGIVVPNNDGKYGPGKVGPSELQDRAAAAIRPALQRDYPKLRVDWRDRKRSILVSFGDPVTPGQKDFTADVITAIDDTTGAGLYIPRFTSWDRSDPEEHTEMIRTRNEITNSSFARVVRLLKHWARTHKKPLCTWNIKALALGVLYSETRMLDGLRVWFDHAIDELQVGLTTDPAGVAERPIPLPDGWTMTEVLVELRDAAKGLRNAVRYEDEGYPALALDELAKVFNDPEMLPGPSLKDLDADIARRAKAVAPSDGTAPLTATSSSPTFPRRAWGI